MLRIWFSKKPGSQCNPTAADVLEQNLFLLQLRKRSAVDAWVRKAELLDDVIAKCEEIIRTAGAVRPGKASGAADKILRVAKGESDGG